MPEQQKSDIETKKLGSTKLYRQGREIMNAHYVLFKHDKSKPSRGIYEIYKSYDDGMIWGSPRYEVLGFFDNRKEAREAITLDKEGK